MINKNLLFNLLTLFAICASIASCSKDVCYECTIKIGATTETRNFCEGETITDKSGGTNDGNELVLTKNDVDEAASDIESLGGQCDRL